MGNGRFDNATWNTYRTSHIDRVDPVRDTAGMYTNQNMLDAYNPLKITLRESCDSDDNPRSRPIIIALDGTGSMGGVCDSMARTGLPKVFEEIYDRKPIADPHIMAMVIGDMEFREQAPLQCTQFEADIRIAEQMTSLYLEKCGGGNDHESYIAAWYFAANKCKIDCFEKRGEKGIIFTIGDENPTPYLTRQQIQRYIGDTPTWDRITAQELLEQVSRQWDVHHIVVKQGSYAKQHFTRVMGEWTALLGQHVYPLSDHTKIGETIISVLEVAAGKDINTVVGSWDGSTAAVVKEALSGIKHVSNTSNDLLKF